MAAMRVKICGMTRAEDVRQAEAAGADAIGIIFVPGSKRFVSPERASEVLSAAGPFMLRVGVFRDEPVGRMLELVRMLRLDAVQLHGNETAEVAQSLRPHVRVIRAVSFSSSLRASQLSSTGADAVLVDGAVPGSGEPFDWQAASFLAGTPGLMLAGGLTPLNVGEAVAALSPYAVDVASGVESAPGIKDPSLMAAFVQGARAGRAAA